MGLGTLMGGWRIIHTMGSKLTQLTPLSGGCAATGAALTLFAATDLGIPVSTTHTVTGAILGVGTSNGWLNTHWPTVRRIIWAWILTIPAAGFVAAVAMAIEIFFNVGIS
jgi:inorganic phosphate transporter, PiT family